MPVHICGVLLARILFADTGGKNEPWTWLKSLSSWDTKFSSGFDGSTQCVVMIHF
jgi:hypothetical protein